MNGINSKGERKVEEIIRSAEQAVGGNDPEDYLIRPTSFVAQMSRTAPELSAVLEHSSLIETAKRYEQQDEKALNKQRLFKQLSNRATWAVFVATVAAALLASVTPIVTYVPEFFSRAVAVLLGLCSLGGGAIAAMSLYRVSEGHMLRDYMSTRAAAESERLSYFNRLTRLVVDEHSDDARLLLQCLEFFRRYQLAIQQNYYRDRCNSHGESRRKTLTIGAVATGVLSVGSGGLGIGASFALIVLPLVALGTIGTGLATVASRREELNQDERNGARYEHTYDLLSRIRERHTEVQRAVAGGKSAILIKYVSAVHEQLSLEHRQWLADTEAMDTTLRELTTSLAE